MKLGVLNLGWTSKKLAVLAALSFTMASTAVTTTGCQTAAEKEKILKLEREIEKLKTYAGIDDTEPIPYESEVNFEPIEPGKGISPYYHGEVPASITANATVNDDLDDQSFEVAGGNPEPEDVSQPTTTDKQKAAKTSEWEHPSDWDIATPTSSSTEYKNSYSDVMTNLTTRSNNRAYVDTVCGYLFDLEWAVRRDKNYQTFSLAQIDAMVAAIRDFSIYCKEHEGSLFDPLDVTKVYESIGDALDECHIAIFLAEEKLGGAEKTQRDEYKDQVNVAKKMDSTKRNVLETAANWNNYTDDDKYNIWRASPPEYRSMIRNALTPEQQAGLAAIEKRILENGGYININ